MSLESTTKLEQRVDALEAQVAELMRDKTLTETYVRMEVAKAQRPQPRQRVTGLIRQERREP